MADPPRILVDLSVAPYGGAATYARGFSAGLRDADLEAPERIVVVVDSAWRRDHGEELSWLEAAAVTVDPVEFPPSGTWSARLRRGRALRGVVDRHQVDAAYFPREVAPRVGVPFAVLANNLYAWQADRTAASVGAAISHRLLRVAARSTARRAAAVLAVSAGMADALPSRVVVAGVVHHGCLLPEQPRDVPDGSEEAVAPRRVSMFGTVSPHKGMDVVIEAVGLARAGGAPWELRIYGGRTDGGVAERLEQRAAEHLGGSVLCGPVSGQALVTAYGTSDVLVVGSTFESFCHPLVEGMRSGCVVVAPEGPLTREICQDVAVTYREGDASSLADALEVGWQERGERSRRGVERSRAFSWSDAVEATVDLVRALAGTPR